ncbi:transcriptional regulator [Sphingomonas sp. Leaf62]|uniref:transcriptional regulator n=1 Tax=Sphingomonas sp. Leaf62 TaxID=1736228 RepID=UPI00190FE2AB|nr:YdaS family helix-turn-helix protein [Sphingomonas sp. Leaf62]
MDNESTMVVALRSAVDAAGSQSAMARIVGCSPQAVSKWVNRGKVCPAEYVLKVEAATGVSRFDLRPDVYPRTEAPVPDLFDHTGGAPA